MAINRNRVAQEAEKLLQQGKTDAAIEKYELLVKDNPRDLNTINKIGDLCSRLGRKREAIQQFNKIGESYSKDGFFLKAIAIYKKILKLDPAHTDSCERLADLYARQGLVLEARSQYQLIADRYLKVGEQGRAIQAFRELVRLDPESHKQREALADLLSKCGEKAAAAEEYLGVGTVLERKGMQNEAKAAYERAAAEDPASPAVAARLPGVSLAAGEHAEAMSVLDRALSVPGDHPDLLSLLSDVQMQQGRAKEAESALARALAVAPVRVDLRMKLARVRLAMHDGARAFEALAPNVGSLAAEGRAAEAIDLLEEALGLAPSHAGVLAALAEVYANQKHEEKSLGCLTRLLDLRIESNEYAEAQGLAEAILRRRPDDEGVRENLHLVQMARSGTVPSRPAGAEPNETPAVEDPEPSLVPVAIETQDEVPPPAEAQRLSPEDEDFISEHMTEADVFVKYGLADRAIEQLNAITARFPRHVPAREKLKEVYLEEGRRDAARDEMILMVRMHAEGGALDVARSSLAELRHFDPACGELAALAALVEAGGGSTVCEPLRAMSSAVGAAAPIVDPLEDVDGAAAWPSPEESGAPTQAELQEIDLYLESGLSQEAVAGLRHLADRHGNHPEILVRMKRALASVPRPAPPAPTAGDGPAAATARPSVEEKEEEEVFEISLEDEADTPAAAASPAPETPAGKGSMEDLLDLASEIDAALGAQFAVEDADVSGASAEPEGASLEEIVEAFKKGVEQQVGAEDHETHYNLGIAYKEMGLIDEAIGEFQIAAKDARLLVGCCTMLGLCFKDKGMQAQAIKWYRRGVDADDGADDESSLGLRYELADLLADAGQLREAMELYSEVFGTNSKFRDVAARIRALQSMQKP